MLRPDTMSDVLLETPANPVPPNHFAGYFESFDGMKLRYAVFRSGSQVPRGTIGRLAVKGVAENTLKLMFNMLAAGSVPPARADQVVLIS